MELSKSEKKLAREIIEKGLQKEFAKGLLEADSVLTDWKTKGKNNRDAYHQLYKKITDFDKHIAFRYDGMTGSRYIEILLAQLKEGLIEKEDLENFSEQVKQTIKYLI